MTRPGSIREEFLASAGLWLGRLRAGGSRPADDEGAPRDLVNLSHRLSDTLPTSLAERVERFIDEFWTLCEERWPTGGGRPAEDSDDLAIRLDGLARSWTRIKRDLSAD